MGNTFILFYRELMDVELEVEIDAGVEVEVDVELEVEVEVEVPEVEFEVEIEVPEVEFEVEIEAPEVEVEIEFEVEIEVPQMALEVDMNAPIVEVEIGGSNEQVVYVQESNQSCCCTACCCTAWAVIFIIFCIGNIGMMIACLNGHAHTTVNGQTYATPFYLPMIGAIIDLILVFVFCKCAKQKKAHLLGGNVEVQVEYS